MNAGSNFFNTLVDNESRFRVDLYRSGELYEQGEDLFRFPDHAIEHCKTILSQPWRWTDDPEGTYELRIKAGHLAGGDKPFFEEDDFVKWNTFSVERPTMIRILR